MDSSVRKFEDTVVVFLVLLLILLGDLDLDRKRPHQSPEHRTLEAQGCEDNVGPLPPVDVEQVSPQGREHEGAHPGAAHGYPRGQGPLLLEVVAHSTDGGQVDQTEAETSEDAVENHQHRDIDCEHG